MWYFRPVSSFKLAAYRSTGWVCDVYCVFPQHDLAQILDNDISFTLYCCHGNMPSTAAVGAAFEAVTAA